MSKKLIYLAAALSIFAACDKTVETPVNHNAIGFEGAFVNKAVKSTGNDLTTDNISMFKVYGYVNNFDGKLFNGTVVNKTNNNTETLEQNWSYSPTEYWVDGGNYYFTALAQNPLENGELSMNLNQTSIDEPGTITFTSDGETDIAYDYVQRLSTNGSLDKSAVGFNFKHLLSKVKFSVKNATATSDNLSFQVSEVKVNGVVNKGVCTLSASADNRSTWVKANDATTGELSFGVINEATDDAGTAATLTAGQTYDTQYHKFILALPNNAKSNVTNGYEKLTVSAAVKVFEAGQEIKTVNVSTEISNFDFVAGYAYNFVCELTRENMGLDNPIKFYVASVEAFTDYTETQWTTTSSITVSQGN